MTTRGRHYLAMGAILAALIGTYACNNDDYSSSSSGGGGSSNLVVSASSPADGDGTLTASGVLTVNAGGTGFDELNLSQTVGGVNHQVTVTWNTSTYAINSVQHAWGSGGVSSGFTQCAPGGTTCDPAKVTVNFAGYTVTFNGLVLPDVLGGTSTSTLTGPVAW